MSADRQLAHYSLTILQENKLNNVDRVRMAQAAIVFLTQLSHMSSTPSPDGADNCAPVIFVTRLTADTV